MPPISNTTLIILGGALFLIVIGAAIFWRIRSEYTITKPPRAPSPADRDRPMPEPAEISSPTYEDMVNPRIADEGYSSQLQTAGYNIRIEQVGNQTRFVVNGVSYSNLQEIPEDELRQMTQKLMDKTFTLDRLGEQGEKLRQVIIGNQTTLEARSPEYTISIQREGNQTRYIVNGLTYESINEIPDLSMSRRAKELEKKML